MLCPSTWAQQSSRRPRWRRRRCRRRRAWPRGCSRSRRARPRSRARARMRARRGPARAAALRPARRRCQRRPAARSAPASSPACRASGRLSPRTRPATRALRQPSQWQSAAPCARMRRRLWRQLRRWATPGRAAARHLPTWQLGRSRVVRLRWHCGTPRKRSRQQARLRHVVSLVLSAPRRGPAGAVAGTMPSMRLRGGPRRLQPGSPMALRAPLSAARLWTGQRARRVRCPCVLRPSSVSTGCEPAVR